MRRPRARGAARAHGRPRHDLRPPDRDRAGHQGGRDGRARPGDRLRRLDRSRHRAAPPLRGRGGRASTSIRMQFEVEPEGRSTPARAARSTRCAPRSCRQLAAPAGLRIGPSVGVAVGGVVPARLGVGAATRYLDGPRPRLFAHRGASGTHPGEHARGVRRRPRGRRRSARARRARHRRRPRRRAARRRCSTARPTAPGRFASARSPRCARSTPASASRPPTASHPWRGRGVRVPTLDELLAAHPGVPLNIEVKQEEPAHRQKARI